MPGDAGKLGGGHELTTGLSTRTRQRCRVQVDGRRQQHVLIALALVLSGACAAAWWQASAPQEEPALSAEEIQARAREMFARPAEPQVLPHPWASLITVPDLLSRCRALQSPAPSVLEAWSLPPGAAAGWRFPALPGQARRYRGRISEAQP
ncbi:type 4b pilus protein PilO2 [Leclercia adecarboxylata]|uniref:type 4b pilus protein PilO2 n=1 Tax=Leclercia adecarboxylata TaxID=83655 RepID=UPI00374F04FF